MSPLRPLLFAAVLSLLAGCDQLGLESATVTAARVEADGKAVGAACRHGGRAIEDCFTLNRKTDKAAIYAGWREMDDYMRENKIEAVASTLSVPKPKTDGDGGDDAPDPASAPLKTAKDDEAGKPAEKGVKAAEKMAKASEKSADKPGDKAGDKAGDKPGDKPAEKTASADADKGASPH
jgi:hypothetical protein